MMRLFIAKFLMVGLVLFGATSASAYSFSFQPPSAATVAVDGTFTIQMRLSTDGVTDTTSIFVSVYFDPAVLEFVSGNGPPSILVGAYDALGKASNPVIAFGDPPGYVRGINYVTPAPDGTGVSGDNVVAGLLTFKGLAGGQTTIDFVYGSTDTITRSTQPITAPEVAALSLGSSATITVIPEPGTALLMGLGLAGLGLAGRRNA